MAKIQRYTKAWEKAVEQAQEAANRTSKIHNVQETVYGVFWGTTAEFPANTIGCYNTVIRPQ